MYTGKVPTNIWQLDGISKVKYSHAYVHKFILQEIDFN